jgi:hypothetical protein
MTLQTADLGVPFIKTAFQSRDFAVGIVTGLRLGKSWFSYLKKKVDFYLQLLEPGSESYPSVFYQGLFSDGLKWLGSEADISVPCGTKLK